MKVRPAVATAYTSLDEVSERLKTHVDKIFGNKPEQWHYFSRVKTEQSYALKLETGRVSAMDAMEDFFACTIVVPTASSISEGIDFVRTHFTELDRRPPADTTTSKAPSDFRFDDLRIYASLPENTGLPKTAMHDIKFEIQIKTFLQHAWAVATHDLIYKGDIDWARSRVGFQIKALLEHAETAISALDDLGKVPSLPTEGRAEEMDKSIVAVFRNEWPAEPDSAHEGLPSDERRLASNVKDLMKQLSIKDPSDIADILEEGRQKTGAHPISLTPFQALVGYLINSRHKEKMKQLVLSGKVGQRRIQPGKEYHLALTEDQLETLDIASDAKTFALVL